MRDDTRWGLLFGLMLAVGTGACSDEGGSTDSDTGGDDVGGDTGGADVTLPVGCDMLLESSGGDDYETVQSALLDAPSDTTICFGAGTFAFSEGLTLTTRGITLRGSPDGTTWDFSTQTAGSNGLLITADDFTIEDFTMVDSPGDTVRSEGVENIVFRNLDVSWSGEPREENGAYAVFPVASDGVLIENCRIFGASDAGLYVGQSSNIIVRDNEVHGNVAGIEIENSFDAEVHDNLVYDNTGGILAFNLANLPVKNGRRTRIYNNVVEDNNRPNFAPEGNIVAAVPAGTGMMVLAYDAVEFHDNTIEDNDSAAIILVSSLILSAVGVGGGNEDPDHDVYPETIYIHDNTFTNNGTSPDSLIEDLVGETSYDILWDGLVDTAKPNTDGELDLCIDEDGATFINIDLPGGFNDPSTDLTPHECTHDTLPPLDLFPPEE